MPSSNLFAGITAGSIDYSPYQPTPEYTIILEDTELIYASEGRMERFWRVWYTERSFYAPALKKFVIGLRPQVSSWEGIRRFLEFFETEILYRYPRVYVDIYILADASDGPNMRRILGDKPRLIHSVRAPADPAEPKETVVA